MLPARVPGVARILGVLLIALVGCGDSGSGVISAGMATTGTTDASAATGGVASETITTRDSDETVTVGSGSTETGFEPTTGGGPTGETGVDPSSGDATTGDATTGDGGPFVVYLDPGGDDVHGGRTPDDAVLTLKRAQEILIAAAPESDVEVRIAQGTYFGQSVTWTYYHPVYRVAFMPIDYMDGDGIGDIAGRPVFDGEGGSSWLSLSAAAGEETRLEFYYLRVERYLGVGLGFKGDRDDEEAGWNGGNRVFGMYFTLIGSKHVPGDQGYGALDLVNSRFNDIRNNHFVAVENDAMTAGLMHAVYLAHHSSNNEIRNNDFTEVSGDPIRARDGSDANIVEGNTFERTGIKGFYSDWYCDTAENPDCTKPGGECPSWENEFRDNELHCGRDGGDIPTFAYIQGAPDYVPPNCPDHFEDGWKRLYTSGNTKSCP